MNLFDVRDLHDALYPYAAKDGKAHKALKIVRSEVARGMVLGYTTPLARDFGNIMLGTARNAIGGMTEREEAVLLLAITAMRDAVQREAATAAQQAEKDIRRLRLA